MSDTLKDRPLRFGDPEQISELKRRELTEEFADLPNCKKCNGDGDCDCCGRECLDCDGNGKEYVAFEKFKSAHPGWRR